MYVGLTVSIALHLSLLGWALISFAGTPPLKIPQIQPVEVAIITNEDLVRLRKGDRSSKKLETRKAKQTQKSKKPTKNPVKKPPKRRAPPPAAAPARTVQAKPEAARKAPARTDAIAQKLASLATQSPKAAPPQPDALALKRKAEAEKKRKADEARKKAAERKKQAEAKRKREQLRKKRDAERRRKLAAKRKREKERKRKLAEAKRRKEAEEKKRKQFDPGRISALLDKLPDQRAPKAGAADAPDDKSLPTGARAGSQDGRDNRLTSSQVAMIAVMMRNSVKRCWNINSGLQGAQNLVVDVAVRLRPDGSLDGSPRVENMRSGPAFRDAANSALRALVQCAPYDLPAKFYKGGWDHMVVTFDPQKMF